MSVIEMTVFAEIAAAKKFKVATLGLRFDRVATRVINDLHEFADDEVPRGSTILVTITAPIRLPSKTTSELCSSVNAIQSGATVRRDKQVSINGNGCRLRVVRHSNPSAPKLLGAVHNLTSDPRIILEILEEWLRE